MGELPTQREARMGQFLGKKWDTSYYWQWQGCSNQFRAKYIYDNDLFYEAETGGNTCLTLFFVSNV